MLPIGAVPRGLYTRHYLIGQVADAHILVGVVPGKLELSGRARERHVRRESAGRRGVSDVLDHFDVRDVGTNTSGKDCSGVDFGNQDIVTATAIDAGGRCETGAL